MFDYLSLPKELASSACFTFKAKSITKRSKRTISSNSSLKQAQLFAFFLSVIVATDLIQIKCLKLNSDAPITRRLSESESKASAAEQSGTRRLRRASIGHALQMDRASGGELEEEATENEAPGKQLDEQLPKLMAKNQLGGSKLQIVRLIGPESAQNGTQNVTIDCMFKFDKKLDQRLTIKWFFNDELEPIYQWIPELNKRVYSDRYESFLDKAYQVSEDADFMLQAYRWLLAAGNNNDAPATSDQFEFNDQTNQVDSSRRLLATGLNKLAQLGSIGRSTSSRQLLDSLRAALNMDQIDYSRFRALRLVRPTAEMSGRFTCSVSSLDGDDLRSTKLLIYEPAKNFTFTVSRVSSQHYNLTCRASQLFPRPTLSLFRYRAGPLEPQQYAHRPKLAATLLRQEPLSGTQTQLTISAKSRSQQQDLVTVEPAEPNEIVSPPTDVEVAPNQSADEPNLYDITSWALVDESSLSSNVVTQFECLLAIEGTNYEQRQSLALQRGWHVNSAGVAMRSTLVGLFGALASLLCLMLALVSSMLIFKMLKKHAKNRVHQEKSDSSNSSQSSESTNSTGAIGANTNKRSSLDRPTATLTDIQQPKETNNQQQQFIKQHQKPTNEQESDGVYRVPEQLGFGTRYVIGSGNSGQTQYYGAIRQATQAAGSSFGSPQPKQQQKPQQSFQQLNGGTRPLYC